MSITKNAVRAYVEQGANIQTTGGNDVVLFNDKVPEIGADGKPVMVDGTVKMTSVKDAVNLYICAEEKGYTLTKASGFAVGESAAVGAAVAVNIITSDVLADFLGTGTLNGDARIIAHIHSEDDSYGIATAMGADLDRHLQKF